MYDMVYNKFSEQCKQGNLTLSQVSDNFMLVYLFENSKTWKPSTMWSKISMIKSCLEIKENIDVSKLIKSIAYLKRQNVG